MSRAPDIGCGSSVNPLPPRIGRVARSLAQVAARAYQRTAAHRHGSASIAMVGVGRVQLDADGVALQAVGDEEGSSGAGEWIEHRGRDDIGCAGAGRGPAALLSLTRVIADTAADRPMHAVTVVFAGERWCVGPRLHVHHPPPRCPAGRAAAALRRAGPDAALGKLRRVGRKVRLRIRMRGDRPDVAAGCGQSRILCHFPQARRSSGLQPRALVPLRSLCGQCLSRAKDDGSAVLPHRLRIPEVARALRQQEHMLMRRRWAVGDTSPASGWACAQMMSAAHPPAIRLES